MAMKRCPICGEKYSDTYKSCPFCEEEEALQSGSQIRRTAPARGGRRAAKNPRCWSICSSAIRSPSASPAERMRPRISRWRM